MKKEILWVVTWIVLTANLGFQLYDLLVVEPRQDAELDKILKSLERTEEGLSVLKQTTFLP